MPYQLALLIKKSIVDAKGAQQNAYAILQYQYQNIDFSLIYALFAECSIDTCKGMCILHNNYID